MLANFLGKSKPINFILLLSLFTCRFVYTSFLLFETSEFNFFTGFKILCLLGLYLSVFFFFNFIVSKNNLTLDNFYAFFIFAILLSFFLPLVGSLKTLIVILIYALFLRKTYSLKSPKKILQKLFDCGFWLSILFIVTPFSALFAVLIYASVFLHQKLTIRNIIAPGIGFLTPILLYFTYCLWFGQLYLFTNLFYFEIPPSLSLYSNPTIYWITVVILIFSTIAIILKSPKTFSISNSFKKSWILLILNLLVVLLFTLVIPHKNGTELVFLVFPTAIIIANGIEIISNKLIQNIFFLLLLISAFSLPFVL
jgi:hypothetical protein